MKEAHLVVAVVLIPIGLFMLVRPRSVQRIAIAANRQVAIRSRFVESSVYPSCIRLIGLFLAGFGAAVTYHNVVQPIFYEAAVR